jgi:hypothetical protein
MQEQNILLDDPVSNNSTEVNFWMVTSVLLLIITLIGAFIGYKYGNFGGVDAKTLSKKYIEKSKIHFDDLSYDMRSQYIHKENIPYAEADKMKDLVSKNIELTKELENIKKELVLAKTQAPQQDKKNPFKSSSAINEDVASLQEEKDLRAKIENSINNESSLVFIEQISCNDMVPGRYYISATCRDKLKSFLSKYSKEHTFEIIPTVNEDDFVIISKFRKINKELPETQKISKDRIDLLNKYANTGLGKFRSNEIGWLIRQMYGKDTKLKYVPYHIHAKDDRGIIVKAYR